MSTCQTHLVIKCHNRKDEYYRHYSSFCVFNTRFRKWVSFINHLTKFLKNWHPYRQLVLLTGPDVWKNKGITYLLHGAESFLRS
jgi:hypothetical protein